MAVPLDFKTISKWPSHTISQTDFKVAVPYCTYYTDGPPCSGVNPYLVSTDRNRSKCYGIGPYKRRINGKYLMNGPAQFNRIPQVGELVQLGDEAWEVSAVLHKWDTAKQPLCELSLSLTTVNRIGGRAE